MECTIKASVLDDLKPEVNNGYYQSYQETHYNRHMKTIQKKTRFRSLSLAVILHLVQKNVFG
jgi:hypothetical protein